MSDGFRTRVRGAVWMPLPTEGFDITEVALTWKVLRAAGLQVVFATRSGGRPARGDHRLLEGVLTPRRGGLFGKLNPTAEAHAVHGEMILAPEFQHPIPWGTLDPADYDGLFLAGGHAPPIREYLESEPLREKVVRFWSLARPVAAICHGTLVLARARDEAGRSLLFERRATCLPKYRERSAFWLTAWKLGRYYRTYPAYTEDEVKQAMRDPARQFVRGPLDLFSAAGDERRPLVVEDGNLLTGRLPGDTRALATRFVAKVLAPAAATPGRE